MMCPAGELDGDVITVLGVAGVSGEAGVCSGWVVVVVVDWASFTMVGSLGSSAFLSVPDVILTW